MDFASLIKGLDPVSQGTMALLVVLGFFAGKLFPAHTPMRIKLVVFLTLVGFAGSGLAYSIHNARVGAAMANPDAAAGKQPASGQTTGGASSAFGLAGVAHADDGEGWIFLGKYDRDRGTWVEGPTVQLAGSGVPRPGERLRTRRDEDVYDDQPRFNIFNQSWKLGRRVAAFPRDRWLQVTGAPVFVGHNVWCKARPA